MKYSNLRMSCQGIQYRLVGNFRESWFFRSRTSAAQPINKPIPTV